MDFETRFFTGLIELHYGERVENKLRKISSKVEWAKGWPADKRAFWNAEAFMWSYKIDKKLRVLITREVEFLSKGKNLDLGCGSYSYVPSVGYDISEKMLQFNDNCCEKVVGDVEKKLPFSSEEFDSCTAVFLLNYVENYGGLLREIFRVLRGGGGLIAVLYSGKVGDWQRQKEVNDFSAERWEGILEKEGFKVEGYEKGELWFFRCFKQKVIKG
ncbi:class I SAM-dependent methyltransferase [Candidatus Woesearchaeota archaeon]|nr:class I SAM-dependent methyltransferase [Candidatus Woesearchaeota archaeon]